MSSFIVVGDIGGTNSRFTLFEVPRGSESVKESELGKAHKAVGRNVYKNEGYSSFSDVLTTFLHSAKVASKVDVACFAVAGPVTNNTATLTNINWVISGKELENSLGIRKVVLINDFVANGFGLLTLSRNEYDQIQAGEPSSTAPIALIGAGTGLGECFLTSAQGQYEAFPSEGGHVDFAPRSELEDEMLRSLRYKFGRDGKPARVSTERIVSGKGIINIYEFLAKQMAGKVDERCHNKIMSAKEPAKEISALAYDYQLAAKTMEIMMSAYGAEAGNLGLTLIPLGGIYIAGGIAPNNTQYIKDAKSPFLTAFHDKGRLSDLLDRIPIRLVMSEDLGLRGAHVKAARVLNEVVNASSDASKTSSSSPSPSAVSSTISFENLLLVAALGLVGYSLYKRSADH